MSQNVSTAVMQRRKKRLQTDARRESCRKSRQKHIEARRAYDKQRYHGNPERRAQQKKQAVGWGKSNKGKRAAIVAARRMAIKKATPPWLTVEQKAKIRSFYLEAARRDGEWHVDHVYPINGKNSCGLHVPWNLQLLPGDDNRRKGNKVDGAEHIYSSDATTG